MVLPHSHRISRVLCYSGYPQRFACFAYGTITLFCAVFQQSSATNISSLLGPNPNHIATTGLGSYPFAHHYLGNRLFTFFSSGYLDVSVLRVPSITVCIRVMVLQYYPQCVTAFGHLRIIVYLRLPAAYRVLQRRQVPRHPLYALYSLI